MRWHRLGAWPDTPRVRPCRLGARLPWRATVRPDSQPAPSRCNSSKKNGAPTRRCACRYSANPTQLGLRDSPWHCARVRGWPPASQDRQPPGWRLPSPHGWVYGVSCEAGGHPLTRANHPRISQPQLLPQLQHARMILFATQRMRHPWRQRVRRGNIESLTPQRPLAQSVVVILEQWKHSVFGLAGQKKPARRLAGLIDGFVGPGKGRFR